MKRRRKKDKVIIMVALAVVVVSMSIGFAVFSNTLVISSSANVTPEASSFDVSLYSSTSTSTTSLSVKGATSTGATVGTASINSARDTITGVTAGFTAPGQTVTYTFYAHNVGAYIAYLKSINFATVSGQSSTKVCTAGTGATASLVTAACDDITLTVKAGSTSTTSSKTGITSHSLAKGAYEAIVVTITYSSSGDRADGPFTIAFGDITLEYKSADA